MMFWIWLYLLVITIILLATYIFFSTNTIYSLITLISMILLIACVLLVFGSEIFAIFYTLIYIGVIAVFFTFVIMLINLRLETKRKHVTTLEIVGFTFTHSLLNLLLDYYILCDFTNLEKLSEAHEIDYFFSDSILAWFDITTIGFFMFARFGFLTFLLVLILLMVLIIALNILRFIKKNGKFDL